MTATDTKLNDQIKKLESMYEELQQAQTELNELEVKQKLLLEQLKTKYDVDLDEAEVVLAKMKKEVESLHAEITQDVMEIENEYFVTE